VPALKSESGQGMLLLRVIIDIGVLLMIACILNAGIFHWF
jgi:hypothetical protein